MERRLKNKRGRYEEKSLIVFLIIGLVVMFGLAKAAPIPYNWSSNNTALFHAQSAISAWDSNQNQYVINKSIWDYADTDTRPSTYHDPPAQTSFLSLTVMNQVNGLVSQMHLVIKMASMFIARF